MNDAGAVSVARNNVWNSGFFDNPITTPVSSIILKRLTLRFRASGDPLVNYTANKYSVAAIRLY